jgi:2'-5' RNA ligase
VLLGVLEAMPAVDLRLSIDCYGYFKRPQIAWAGPSAAPAKLVELQADLMTRLEEAGFSAAAHGEFKPHITLAREAKEAPGEFSLEPVTWNVTALALVESMPDGRYVPFAQNR